MKDQLYRADCESREVKAKLAEMEREERDERERQGREWENTCEDLAKELKYV